MQSIISKFNNYPKIVNINNCLDKKSKLYSNEMSRTKIPKEITILTSGNLPDVVARRCSAKKRFFKISQNSQENTYVSLFFDKTLVFSCEFCKIFKNTYFAEYVRAAAFNPRCLATFKLKI